MLLRKKEEIEDWLKKHFIKNYELIEDHEYGYTVNINGSLFISYKGLKSIDVKFNEIKGDFDCSGNQLKTLKGFPEIICGYFNCSNNQLISLKNCPKIIRNGFYCSHNELTSLEFSPEIVNGSFNCCENELISLEGCPETITSYFYCNNNLLTIKGLKYLPKELKKNYIKIDNNKELGELQNINNFQELKGKVEEILKIKEEKENLLNFISQDFLIKNKKMINKI